MAEFWSFRRPDGDAVLDIAAGPVADNHNLHRRNLISFHRSA
jgi:hypothetical protein